MNHDALFKMLLKTPSVLQGFFEAFVPEVARFVDFGILEFVDKERFTIDGKKRTGDLLIKTRFRGETAGFLIHLEHQAQHDSDLPRRMKEKELVAGFFSSYNPLDASQALQLETEVGKVKPDAAREAVMNLTNPFIELGKQRGRQEGITEGRRQGEVELVLRLLIRRLGALSAPQEKAIRKLTLPKIEALGEALLEFNSRDDIARWLRLNK